MDIFDKKMEEKEARLLNPLVLAFVGDAVYSLYVKTQLLELSSGKVNKFNNIAKSYVNAKSQSDKLKALKDILTEEEMYIAKRARNSNIHSFAKNFSVEEYRYATAFEALVGYLFLTNQMQRLKEILEYSKGEDNEN